MFNILIRLMWPVKMYAAQFWCQNNKNLFKRHKINEFAD